MKGDPNLIKVLNDRLADELTAVNQYMVHSEMCDNWGYDKLNKMIEARAITEMRHAEKLIGCILFLEGLPIVSDLKSYSSARKYQRCSKTTTTPKQRPSPATTRPSSWPAR